jgi:hypothetical protein
MGSLTLLGHKAVEVLLLYELAVEILGHVLLGLLQGCVADRSFM